MASNGYQQSYRQGPPPPPRQQYYGDQYDQRAQGNLQQNQMYNQESYGYNGYQDDRYDQQHYTPSNDHYEQYEQYEQWDDRQNRYDQRPQQYESGPRQQGQYQYDNRYRENGPMRQPLQPGQGRPPQRPGEQKPHPQNDRFESAYRGNGSYNQGGNGRNRLPKPRERILQQEPESPKTASWDNPFPTFPSKKKSSEARRSGSNDEKKGDPDGPVQSNDVQRPSTSHSNRAPRTDYPPNEPSRPHTSQSQRNFEPLRSPVDIPAMPPRKDLPPPRPHTSHSQRDAEPLRSPSYLPEMPQRQETPTVRPQHSFRSETPATSNAPRPVPQRAMTGPAPSYSFDDYAEPDDLPEQLPVPVDGPHSGYDAHHQQSQYSPPLDRYARDPSRAEPQRQPVPTQLPPSQGTNFNSHRRQSSDQSYGRNQPRGYQDPNRDLYQDMPSAKPLSPDLPNFDMLSGSVTQKTEDHLDSSSQQPRQIYRKPTYQDAAADQPQSRPRQSIEDGNDLASPFGQFAFGLENDEAPVANHTAPPNSNYRDPYGPQGYGTSSQPPLPEFNRGPQGRQQSNSRPGMPSNNDYDGYAPNRPPRGNPPFRPGLVQPPVQSLNREREQTSSEYDRPGYGPGYRQEDGRSQPPLMPRSQNSFQREPSRQGHDPRFPPRPGFAPPQQGPPRPATSNSGRSGPRPEYNTRSSSDHYPGGGMQNPDSLPAHPAPFRPGLMQPTPAAAARMGPHAQPPQPQPQPQPQTQTHQRAPSGSKPQEEDEPPVTVRELNTLQQEYKSNPGNHALGLKFAKRLVEAAKVLADENGRADAKQTAKNRERYILDAHKIVKRLCSSGSSEAMFYFADCYGQGMLGLEPDAKEAFSLYQSAAKLGHAQAAYRVAVCCELGSEEGGGTRRDPLKAVQWYRRAASLGDTPAMYKMGMILLKGLLGQSKSPREAISWLKRAAERADAENPHALHELGLLYESAQPNDIVLKDEKYALQLFQQAADLGYKYSQFRLGSAYEYGLLGLPIDPRMSIAWYSRAAKQGEHQSEFALSGWYLTGSGSAGPGEQVLLPQSDTEAYLWARKAASSGLAKAEYAMGYYTEVGIGVASNIEEAKRWYYRAAAQNHLKARERLEDLKKGGQRMQKTRVSRSNVGKHNEGECVVM